MLMLMLTLMLTLTLTQTLLNPNICAHIVDTQNNFFSEFIKGILCRDPLEGLWVEQIIALLVKTRCWLI